MAKNNYTEEFCRGAVEFYRETDGATVAGIAADLGLSHGALTAWLKNAGIPIRKPCTSGAPRPDPDKTHEQEGPRLRADVAIPARGENQARTERDILRSAAKYSAGETNW